jgi:hypothetical protein
MVSINFGSQRKFLVLKEKAYWARFAKKRHLYKLESVGTRKKKKERKKVIK